MKNGLRSMKATRYQILAEWTGLEPATPGVTGRYSNQLNYHSTRSATLNLRSKRCLQLVPTFAGDPTGIRTPVTTVKGSCPRPLDDRVKFFFTSLPRATLLPKKQVGGGKRDRTADLLHAMQALSQLSYTPSESSSTSAFDRFRFRRFVKCRVALSEDS